MAGPKLDGAGVVKMATLDSAMHQMQRVHALVEQFASAAKSNSNTGVLPMQIRRAVTPLVGLLKPQFGLISDQAVALNLTVGKSGSDQAKARMLREGVASMKQQLEIAITRTKDTHTVEEE